MSALLHIEEYRDGPWEELLTGLGLSAMMFHRGCYTIWTCGEGVEEPQALCRLARRELRSVWPALRQLRAHLRHPMRLELVCRVYTDPVSRRWAAVRVPDKLVLMAARVGATIDLGLHLGRDAD